MRAPLPQSDYDKASARFPFTDILQTYGLSEASPRVAIMGRNDKVLSCGSPVRGTRIKICDCNGYKIDHNSVGQIFVKGLNIMQGYYRDSYLTKKVIKEGWLETGDLGYIDENGKLFVVGRSKNLIISGGNNIYPESIEKFLSQFEEFNSVAILGELDERLGEIPVACVQIKLGINIDLKNILKKCKDCLTEYKIPKRWVKMDEIFFTKTGKIDRIALKREYDKENYRVLYEGIK